MLSLTFANRLSVEILLEKKLRKALIHVNETTRARLLSSRIQRLSNLHIFFANLNPTRNLNMSAEDIVDGNVRNILSLLWYKSQN